MRTRSLHPASHLVAFLTAALAANLCAQDPLFPCATRRQWNLPGDVVAWAGELEEAGDASPTPDPVVVLTRQAELFAFRPHSAEDSWQRLSDLPGEGRAVVAREASWIVATADPNALHHVRSLKPSEWITFPLPFAPTRLAVHPESFQDGTRIAALGQGGEILLIACNDTQFRSLAFAELPTNLAHDLIGLEDPSPSSRPVFVVADGGARELLRWEEGQALQRHSMTVLPRTLRTLGSSFLVCSGTPLGEDAVSRVEWNRGAALDTLGFWPSAGPVTIDALLEDTNRDGRADLSVLNLGHNQLERRLSRADGAWSPPATGYAGQHGERLGLRDLDRDAWPDWLVLSPSARVLSVLPNRGGEPAAPERLVEIRAPTLFVRGEGSPSEVVAYGEGAAEFVVLENDSVQRHAVAGRSLERAARFAGAGIRLLVLDRLADEWLHLELAEEGPLVRRRSPAGSGEWTGPVACSGALWFARVGSSVVRGTRWDEVDRPLPLPFSVARLLPSPHPGTFHVLGTEGEFATWGADELTVLANPLPIRVEGPVTILPGERLDLLHARSDRLERVRMTAEGTFVHTPFRPRLASPPRRLVAVRSQASTRILAPCPAAHVLEWIDLERERVVSLGAGLHPVDVLTRGQGSAQEWLVLCTFSHELLSLRPMDAR